MRSNRGSPVLGAGQFSVQSQPQPRRKPATRPALACRSMVFQTESPVDPLMSGRALTAGRQPSARACDNLRRSSRWMPGQKPKKRGPRAATLATPMALLLAMSLLHFFLPHLHRRCPRTLCRHRSRHRRRTRPPRPIRLRLRSRNHQRWSRRRSCLPSVCWRRKSRTHGASRASRRREAATQASHRSSRERSCSSSVVSTAHRCKLRRRACSSPT